MARAWVAVMAVALAACAGGGEGLVHDPYEPINRRVHAANRALDRAVLRPLALGYDAATPTLIQHLFGNVAGHLHLPGVFANQLMQGEGEAAAATLGRFVVNTLYGAVGLLDPATELGLARAHTDFGITLALWGVGEGPYFEIPLFGPTTSRDGWARVVDLALQPPTYALGAGGAAALGSLGFQAAEIVDARRANLIVIDDLLSDDQDSYIALRTAYIQNRRRRIAGDAAPTEALPDIFAE